MVVFIVDQTRMRHCVSTPIPSMSALALQHEYFPCLDSSIHLKEQVMPRKHGTRGLGGSVSLT
jgi:hypothetical protein